MKYEIVHMYIVFKTKSYKPLLHLLQSSKLKAKSRKYKVQYWPAGLLYAIRYTTSLHIIYIYEHDETSISILVFDLAIFHLSWNVCRNKVHFNGDS